MRNIRACLAGAIFTVCVLASSGAFAGDCKLVEVASLNAKIDAAGVLTVPATIEGHDQYLVVDTGGVYNLLTPEAIDGMHLNLVSAGTQRMRVGLKAQAMNHIAVAHTLQLGNIVASRIPFYELPKDFKLGEAGTIAPLIFAQYDMEIDPAGKKINLFSQDRCPGHVIYWTHETAAAIPMRLDGGLHIIIPVKLDGQDVLASIDTGSSTSWLIYEKATGIFPQSETAKNPADNGAYKYPFKTLSFGGVEVTNPDISVEPNSYRDPGFDVQPLTLGMDVVSRLHMFISYSEHMLYVTAADAH